MRIYLDTSVPSAYLDERTPERRALTVAMWPTLEAHEVCVSDLVIKEIDAICNEDRRRELLGLIRTYRCLDSTVAEVDALAEAYVALEALPPSAAVDALHVAVAVVHGAEVILSWNLKHLVRLHTRRAVNAVNALRRMPSIEILTPPEL